MMERREWNGYETLVKNSVNLMTMMKIKSSVCVCKIQWDTDFIIVLLVFIRYLRLLISSIFMHEVLL